MPATKIPAKLRNSLADVPARYHDNVLRTVRQSHMTRATARMERGYVIVEGNIGSGEWAHTSFLTTDGFYVMCETDSPYGRQLLGKDNA